MRVLGIDTATWRASVGIATPQSIVAERHEMVRSSHAAVLLPMIADVLDEAGLKMRDIDVVAVASGPGSFSGLRIGLSVAKGLALATCARVVGIPSLRGLAVAAGVAGPVCALLDARRGEVYWGVYDVDGEAAVSQLSDRLTSLDTLLHSVTAPVTLVGDGVPVYGEAIRTQLGTAVGLLPFPEIGPRGGVIARLGGREIAAAGDADEELEPNYIRPSEAELKFG